MNEQLQNVTAETLEILKQYLQGVGNLAQEQAPLLCQEIVEYGTIIHGLGVFGGVAMFVVGLILMIGCIKRVESNEVWGVGIGAGAIGMVLGGMMFVINISQFLMAVFAPRLYVLEYIKDFI